MLSSELLKGVIANGRIIEAAVQGDPALGPLAQLPGVWKNADNLVGHGWNMIALPYKEPGKAVNPIHRIKIQLFVYF
jgi:hypothetical protein